MRRYLTALAAWAGRLDTCTRMMTSGTVEVAASPHEPLPAPDRPGYCDLDGLELEDPLHDRRYRRRRAPRPAVDLAAKGGWR